MNSAWGDEDVEDIEYIKTSASASPSALTSASATASASASTMGLQSGYIIPWYIQEEYVDVETRCLFEVGRKYLNYLYKDNQKFKDDFITFSWW